MATTCTWEGIYAVLVTPFTETLDIDVQGLKNQVEFCVSCDAQGIVYPVMASEFFTLTDKERSSVVEVVAATLNNRLPLVVGVSGVSHTHAVHFSQLAEQVGAKAVMAMPPYTKQGTPSYEETKFYYQALASANQLPVIVQNAPEPIGSPLKTQDITRLMQEIPSIKVIKEETPPNPQKIGALIGLGAEGPEGVFGGQGGIYFMNELRRGVSGTMPACQFVDVMVHIYACYKSGNDTEARNVFKKLLPALVMERMYNVAFMKLCLQKRGVITCTRTRASFPQPDEADKAELDLIFDDLAPYFNPRASVKPKKEGVA